MPRRYVITKSTAQGEQITTEVAQCHPVTGDVMHTDDELRVMVSDALSVSNERMVEMNIAMLEAMDLHQYFDSVTWVRFKQLIEVLYGRLQAATLAARWQSEVEETHELESQRLSYVNGNYVMSE
ncbi:MAG: hypothetical protein ACRCZI_14920 [Cetobacterium sp.]